MPGDGTYGSFQRDLNDGLGFQDYLHGNASVTAILRNAVRINPLDPTQQASYPYGWQINIEVYSATDGTTVTLGTFDTEAEANAVGFRINPTSGSCLNACPT